MKPPPSDPHAFQSRIMSALIGDISDTGARDFPRLDALRFISSSTREGREGAYIKTLPTNNGD